MTKHDDIVRLRHMLEHSREALALIQDKAREDLDADRILALASVRLLEIIGEAAVRVSKQTQIRHPVVPWVQIISLRNRLIHGYESVDLDVLWEILSRDLPSLIEALLGIPGLEEGAE